MLPNKMIQGYRQAHKYPGCGEEAKTRHQHLSHRRSELPQRLHHPLYVWSSVEQPATARYAGQT